MATFQDIDISDIQEVDISKSKPNGKLTSIGSAAKDFDNIKYIGRSTYIVHDETGTPVLKKSFREAVRIRQNNNNNPSRSSFRFTIDLPDDKIEGELAYMEFQQEMSDSYGGYYYLSAFHPKGVDTSKHNHVHVLFFNSPKNPFLKKAEIHNLRDRLALRFSKNKWIFNYVKKDQKKELIPNRTQAEVHILEKQKEANKEKATDNKAPVKMEVWKEEFRKKISECKDKATSWTEFEQLLKEAGIKIKVSRSNVTFYGLGKFSNGKEYAIKLCNLFSGIKTKEDLEAMIINKSNLRRKENTTMTNTDRKDKPSAEQVVNELYEELQKKYKGKELLDALHKITPEQMKELAKKTKENDVLEINNYLAGAKKIEFDEYLNKPKSSRDVVVDVYKSIKKEKKGTACIEELQKIMIDKQGLKWLAGLSTENDINQIKLYVQSAIKAEQNEMRELEEADRHAKRNQQYKNTRMEGQAEKIKEQFGQGLKSTALTGFDGVSGIVSAASQENPVAVLNSGARGIFSVTLKIAELMRLKKMMNEQTATQTIKPVDIKEVAQRMKESSIEAYGEKVGRKVFYMFGDEERKEQLEYIAGQEKCNSEELKAEIVEQKDKDIEYQKELQEEIEEQQEIDIEPEPKTGIEKVKEDLGEMLSEMAEQADKEINITVDNTIDNLDGVESEPEPEESRSFDIDDEALQGDRRKTFDRRWKEELPEHIRDRKPEIVKTQAPEPSPKLEPKPQLKAKAEFKPELDTEAIKLEEKKKISETLERLWNATLHSKGGRMELRTNQFHINVEQMSEAVREWIRTAKNTEALNRIAKKFNLPEREFRQNFEQMKDSLIATFKDKSLLREKIYGYAQEEKQIIAKKKEQERFLDKAITTTEDIKLTPTKK